MDPATVDSLKEALTPLAERLGESGAAAWEMAVRQQQIEAFRALLWPLFLVMALFVSWRFYRWAKAWDGEDASYSATDDHQITLVIAGITLACTVLLLILGTAIEGTSAIGRLINPEWYALQSLLDLVVEK